MKNDEADVYPGRPQDGDESDEFMARHTPELDQMLDGVSDQ